MAPDDGGRRSGPTLGAIVPTQAEHAALRAVETLGVGSAKVPHLPILEPVIAAPDAVSVLEAIRAERPALEAFAGRLERVGLAGMAATVHRALAACRWNADLRSLLEWVYGASFKTAGRATMSFAPWYSDSSCSAPEAVWDGGSSCSVVRLPPDVVEQAALANALVYERLIGGLNACGEELGDDASCRAVCARLAAAAERGAPLHPALRSAARPQEPAQGRLQAWAGQRTPAHRRERGPRRSRLRRRPAGRARRGLRCAAAPLRSPAARCRMAAVRAGTRRRTPVGGGRGARRGDVRAVERQRPARPARPARTSFGHGAGHAAGRCGPRTDTRGTRGLGGERIGRAVDTCSRLDGRAGSAAGVLLPRR